MLDLVEDIDENERQSTMAQVRRIRDPLERAEATWNLRLFKPEVPGVVYTHVRPNHEILDGIPTAPADEEIDWVDFKGGRTNDLERRRTEYEHDCKGEEIVWCYYYYPKLLEALLHLSVRARHAKRKPYPCHGCKKRHCEHASLERKHPLGGLSPVFPEFPPELWILILEYSTLPSCSPASWPSSLSHRPRTAIPGAPFLSAPLTPASVVPRLAHHRATIRHKRVLTLATGTPRIHPAPRSRRPMNRRAHAHIHKRDETRGDEHVHVSAPSSRIINSRRDEPIGPRAHIHQQPPKDEYPPAPGHDAHSAHILQRTVLPRHLLPTADRRDAITTPANPPPATCATPLFAPPSTWSSRTTSAPRCSTRWTHASQAAVRYFALLPEVQLAPLDERRHYEDPNEGSG
ncbi:hypothetical protein DFH07DRAFT_962233 [Mycena maculata]|uniref:Uncharacterized protein n=1 Tax=Mycena maculata TaxID=230809 RepID=A0AAD7IRN2_9AGAR|nr:hypothetical protein DFH07DRAFT_962233 [Mycena maculata]